MAISILHISILNNYYLIFNVIIVIAANTIVTIQKRMVILDSWNSLSGLVNTTLHPGSIRLMEVRKWSCIGVLLKRRCFTLSGLACLVVEALQDDRKVLTRKIPQRMGISSSL